MNIQKQISIVHRKTCRICQSTNTTKILSFDKMPLTDDFVTLELLGKEFLSDIDVYVCGECYTVQTLHDVDMAEYYNSYHYSVGASNIATRFMENIATGVVEKYFSHTKNIRVLEVGSGDGSQLLPFKKMGCEVLGYEPSAYLTDIARERGVPTIQGLFNENSLNKMPQEFKEIEVVLLSYTFDHLPEPIEFMQTIRSIISLTQGILVIEVHDLGKLFSRREYCLFEHEHSIYLTRKTAQLVMQKEGFEIIDFDLVPDTLRRANSLIFVATPNLSVFSSARLPAVELQEFQDLNFYKKQAVEIRQGIRNLERFVDRLVLEGKTLAGYSAGGLAIMTLATMENAHEIQYLVDKNPKGTNVFSPKVHIPIFGLDKLKSSPVHAIIVFNYGYMKEIQEDCQALGYSSEQIYSLIDVMAGKFE